MKVSFDSDNTEDGGLLKNSISWLMKKKACNRVLNKLRRLPTHAKKHKIEGLRSQQDVEAMFTHLEEEDDKWVKSTKKDRIDSISKLGSNARQKMTPKLIKLALELRKE